ncbi:hypothetical protein [Cellulomonas shaoxiangyii]|uniref:Heavy metal transporter n=1 Tax=Cellulomonas shaoxiangyii TaxID=2566013 RepID=A0A4V1CMW3_9CELL|nr:hypothetical protein [Cellulomonas shaoxiangyii]QCB94345.1 hypothetical protein E5225_13060 [Cellulomonas shaoxiangyii]TGY85184.1 hypothetical protein E5226_07645 [Cellulomonas shaoxiangyii]
MASLVLVGVLVAAVAGVVTLLDRTHPAAPTAERCVAHLDGTDWRLSPDQAQNAALVSALAVRRGLPARAVTIGIATALQESKLVNIDYGDRDSVGLFQQRPSQGWGTVEEIMDPVYSTGRFYDGLVEVPGYGDMPITEAAQAVQRSGFPDAYAQHEGRARAWASGLTGFSPAAVTCDLRPADGAAGTDPLLGRLVRDLGELPVAVRPADAAQATPHAVDVTADALAPGDPPRAAWVAAHWAVAVAAEVAVDEVAVADLVWSRGAPTWGPAEAPLPAGQVRIVVAG